MEIDHNLRSQIAKADNPHAAPLATIEASKASVTMNPPPPPPPAATTCTVLTVYRLEDVPRVSYTLGSPDEPSTLVFARDMSEEAANVLLGWATPQELPMNIKNRGEVACELARFYHRNGYNAPGCLQRAFPETHPPPRKETWYCRGPFFQKKDLDRYDTFTNNGYRNRSADEWESYNSWPAPTVNGRAAGWLKRKKVPPNDPDGGLSAKRAPAPPAAQATPDTPVTNRGGTLAGVGVAVANALGLTTPEPHAQP